LKKIVIFDLDGTLVNSIYDLADCVNAALASAGLPQNSLKEYYTFVGNGIENLIRTSMKECGEDDELYRRIRKEFDELYELHCNDKTVAYDGIEELLCRMKAEGFSTAVLSNKAHRFVGTILKKCFPSHEFDAAWGQQDCIKRKPDAEGVERLLKLLDFSKEECVYIGDSDVDVITAKNADVDMIGVLWGFRGKEELVNTGAKYVASNTEELFKIITEM